MITSSLSAFLQLRAERPDLADCLTETFYFSRQQEEAPDEGRSTPSRCSTPPTAEPSPSGIATGCAPPRTWTACRR